LILQEKFQNFLVFFCLEIGRIALKDARQKENPQINPSTLLRTGLGAKYWIPAFVRDKFRRNDPAPIYPQRAALLHFCGDGFSFSGSGLFWFGWEGLFRFFGDSFEGGLYSFSGGEGFSSKLVRFSAA